MRNYKSISNYFEFLDAIKDTETGYVYSLDYCTGECYPINFEDKLKGRNLLFIKLPNCIELYWDESSFYVQLKFSKLSKVFIDNLR